MQKVRKCRKSPISEEKEREKRPENKIAENVFPIINYRGFATYVYISSPLKCSKVVGASALHCKIRGYRLEIAGNFLCRFG